MRPNAQILRRACVSGAKEDLEIWVAHFWRLRERRVALERSLARQGLEANWCTDDQADRAFFSDDLGLFQRKIAALEEPQGPYETPALVPAGVRAISWTHYRIWQQVAAGSAPYALVLEDDALLDKEFMRKFPEYLGQTPAGWDLAFLGCGANLHVPSSKRVPGRLAYRMDPPRSRCADSYLLTRRAATILAGNALPFSLPVDWELWHLLRRHHLEVFWWEPPLVRQGSETGQYRSNLRQEKHHYSWGAKARRLLFRLWHGTW